MTGATVGTILTIDKCTAKLSELFQLQNQVCFGWGMSEEEIALLEIQISVWERLREHVTNGEIVTINGKDEIVWFDQLGNC